MMTTRAPRMFGLPLSTLPLSTLPLSILPLSTLPLSVLVLVVACSGPTPGPDGTSAETYDGYLAHNLMLGENDNPEVVAIVPGTQMVLVVSSKSRELVLLRALEDRLVEVRSESLFESDSSESELTHVAVEPGGQWAVVTRTLVEQDRMGRVTECRGQVVFVSSADDERFGQVLRVVDVGPMPDSVDISPDGRRVVVANERDVVWGKCEGAESVDPPSLSVLSVDRGPSQAEELTRITMVANVEREPESVSFLPDGTAAVVTLQDSHEVAFLPVEGAVLAGNLTDADLHIVPLPKSSVGQDAWPDGVTTFLDGEGIAHLAVAGEANDAITVLDAEGAVVTMVEVGVADVPLDYPRDGTWGPLFRPDSLTAFEWAERVYLAVGLKASGALGVWDVTDLESVELVSMVKLGQGETGGPDAESSVGTEGIAASSDHGFIVTANEAEGSVSLVRPLR